MSIDVMNAVWKHAPVQSGEFTVLLALADFADENGSCFPSISTLAAKARLKDRQAQNCLRALTDAGFVRVERGAGPRGCNRYVIDVAAIEARSIRRSSDAGETGGANIAPLQSGAQGVQSSASGGAMECTQTTIEPPTEPSDEREARASEREDGQSPEPVNRKSIERAFERAFQAWPTSISDSRPEALKAWLDLSPEERNAAFAEAGRYAEAARATGRKHLCSHAVYLREKRWQALPPREEADKATTATEAKPFGALWQAARLKVLLEGPKGPPPVLTAMERILVEQGRYTVDELIAEKRVKTGFPSINGMHDRAANRQGVTVAMTLEPLARLMEPVPVGSERFEEWREEHRVRGWPWLPDTGAQPVVYFPQGGPAELDEFEAAVKRLNEGCGNDGGQREAAE